MANDTSKSHTVYGHEQQRARLKSLAERHKLPSTLLFSGPAGVGKRVVSQELVGFLLCESANNCHTCKSCKLLQSGNHPDFIRIDAVSEEDSQIDQLREVLSILSRKSFIGASRIIQIDHADQLSRQSANLLLKSLEEPRPNNYFVLLADNAHSLPDTVLSRSQLWFFDKLLPAQLTQVLNERTDLVPQGMTVEQAVVLLDGSLASLDKLAEGLEEAKNLASEVRKIAAGDMLAGIALAQKINSNKELIALRVELLRVIADQKMRTAETHAEQSRWATFGLNLIEAGRLINNRNLNASYLLALTFERLASPAQFTQLLAGDTLLSETTI